MRRDRRHRPAVDRLEPRDLASTGPGLIIVYPLLPPVLPLPLPTGDPTDPIPPPSNRG